MKLIDIKNYIYRPTAFAKTMETTKNKSIKTKIKNDVFKGESSFKRSLPITDKFYDSIGSPSSLSIADGVQHSYRLLPDDQSLKNTNIFVNQPSKKIKFINDRTSEKTAGSDNESSDYYSSESCENCNHQSSEKTKNSEHHQSSKETGNEQLLLKNTKGFAYQTAKKTNSFVRQLMANETVKFAERLPTIKKKIVFNQAPVLSSNVDSEIKSLSKNGKRKISTLPFRDVTMKIPNRQMSRKVFDRHSTMKFTERPSKFNDHKPAWFPLALMEKKLNLTYGLRQRRFTNKYE